MASLGAYKLKQWRIALAAEAADETVPERGVSQKVAADKLGVSAMLISYWENGHRLPGRKLALRLQKMGIADLLDWHLPSPAVAAA